MKAKQWQEMKGFTVVELESKLRAAEEQQFRLTFKHASTPLKNGLQIRTLRRTIAQFKTLLQERSAEKTKAAKGN